jgi:heme-degrading monooxygenase HmoA
MHLAELNVGVLAHPKGSPEAAEFFDNLERVNGLAERMPGFVWRLKDDGGDATNFRLPGSDGEVAVNLSVWESAETLQAFVFRTVHAGFYRKRAAWFTKMATPHFVMWWVEEGHRPSLDEARGRLDLLARDGPSDRAFGWEELPDAQALRSQRCG